MWESEAFDNRQRIMYFWTSFSVSPMKHLVATFLHHQRATRPCCCTLDIYCRSCPWCWRVLLKCWVGRSLDDRTVNFAVFHCAHPKLQIRPTILISLKCTGSHQCMSPVGIRCMVLEIQLILIRAFQKVVASCFHELGPNKSRKNWRNRKWHFSA